MESILIMVCGKSFTPSIIQLRRSKVEKFLKFTLVLALFVSSVGFAVAEKATATDVKVETLVKTTAAWDGTAYNAYPSGQPEITVLKITIAPHSVLQWHTHPIPNAAYILSGELTVEKKDGTQKHFVAGQVVAETVETIHRGMTRNNAAVLIVFYSGTPGMPLSQEARLRGSNLHAQPTYQLFRQYMKQMR
jgi:quercetin dioxygenase-like cupin family protein